MNMVKPLEWRGSVAHSAFGDYSVDRDFDDDVAAYPWCCWSPADDGTNLGHFATLPEAKAAARADYEARIRSALASPVERPAEEGDELATERNAHFATASAYQAAYARVIALQGELDAARDNYRLAHQRAADAVRDGISFLRRAEAAEAEAERLHRRLKSGGQT